MAKTSNPRPPFIVLFGDEEYAKSRKLGEMLDRLLPPDIDRTLALTNYDGAQKEDSGGPSLASVLDDLNTLPFLADRRVVVIREADAFISTHRERLERYAARPSPTGVLLLECRSFPKTTRLYKAIEAADGALVECRKLSARAAPEFVVSEAAARGKQIDRAAAGELAELIGPEQGLLAAEVEKLSLFIGDRRAIGVEDVRALVGQSREEKIFAVMDAAGCGRLDAALRLWNQVLETDRAAAFRATGGIAFVLRRWLTAQRMRAEGSPVRAIAPKVMMWGRENDLELILQRLSPHQVRRMLRQLAELDAQAKSGARSIETGIEALLVEAAAP